LAKHLRIRGVVQGVGYRAGLRSEASALNLSGWVRNRLDGSVEAIVSGTDQALEQIIDWAWHGPPGAQVREISIDDLADSTVAGGKFHILPTA
jgi:acylphosphatase